jgi:RNA polymerase sigma-70 factor, ECF subfamily
MQIADDRHNAESFGREIAKHIPRLRKHAKFLTRNDESAADLTQDTLAKAWAARSRFAEGSNLKAWLLTIMRNHFRSEMRRAWRQLPWDQESAERISAPRDEQNWSIELTDASRAIGTLSKRQREALLLAAVGGLSIEEVGAIARCGTSAAKSRVCRARQTMRSMLDGSLPLETRRSGERRNTIDDFMHQLHMLTANASSVLGASGAPTFV